MVAFVPEVPQQNKLSDRIRWKTEKGSNENENGSMYGQYPVKGYAVSVPNKQSIFGKSMTSRYKSSNIANIALANQCYISAGAARMETDENTVIGELNNAATW